MTETTAIYRERLDSALTAAGGPEEGWNTRFRAALDREGMTLGPLNVEPDDRYPRGLAYTAPLPYLDDPNGWDKDTCVLFKD